MRHIALSLTSSDKKILRPRLYVNMAESTLHTSATKYLLHNMYIMDIHCIVYNFCILYFYYVYVVL